jgi:hypothetical protein
MTVENSQSHAGCDHAYGYCAEELDNRFRSQGVKRDEAAAGWDAGEDGQEPDAHYYATSKWYRFEYDRATAEVSVEAVKAFKAAEAAQAEEK